MKMDIRHLENTMKPVTGTMREGLHAALDDLMNDVEKESGAVVGGSTVIQAEKNGYRHTLTLTIAVVTEPICNSALS